MITIQEEFINLLNTNNLLIINVYLYVVNFELISFGFEYHL